MKMKAIPVFVIILIFSLLSCVIAENNNDSISPEDISVLTGSSKYNEGIVKWYAYLIDANLDDPNQNELLLYFVPAVSGIKEWKECSLSFVRNSIAPEELAIIVDGETTWLKAAALDSETQIQESRKLDFLDYNSTFFIPKSLINDIMNAKTIVIDDNRGKTQLTENQLSELNLLFSLYLSSELANWY